MANKGMALLALAFLLLWFGQLSFLLTFLVVAGVYVSTGGWRFLKVIYRTGKRDLFTLKCLLKMKLRLSGDMNARRTIAQQFVRTAAKHPDKVALVSCEQGKWTFRELDAYSNRIAHYFKERGFGKGDTIALFLESRPEFVGQWLGLSKIGVVPALINFNLRTGALLHCIKAGEASAVLFGTELTEAMDEIQPDLASDVRLFSTGRGSGGGDGQVLLKNVEAIDGGVEEMSSKSPPPLANAQFTDKLFYIYTSGTTGMPKAAVITHARYTLMAFGIGALFRIHPDDVIYTCLPLYHSAGGILGIGQMTVNGCTVVIRKKFSASRFWDDCVKYKCTAAQYIGEICRYLLATPPCDTEKRHNVRVMYGNGMRPNTWKAFVDRFRIEQIGEFYGATEGNANIANVDNKVGAVGFKTLIAPSLYPVTLIKVDEETGKEERDENGICIQCGPGEQGELVGKILAGDVTRRFDGYVDAKATNKKIVQNVYKRGDASFRTGDILEMDEDGYMYFKDRTGDTFRWRGENVSTTEVEAVVSKVVGLGDVVVYGVEVPGAEGRAGMVAVVDKEKQIDPREFVPLFRRNLPSYAIPLFFRLVETADLTSTFKLKKTNLVKEGFNPNTIPSGSLFMLDAKSAQYIPLTAEVYADILAGRLRL